MSYKLSMPLTGGLFTCALVFLSGCATQEKPLYYWGSYQAQTYAYFKGEASPEEQIIALEEDVQKARAEGLELPPGYHAHLGMLYAKVGKEDQVVQQLETERTYFPESASFMDFLLRKFGK